MTETSRKSEKVDEGSQGKEFVGPVVDLAQSPVESKEGTTDTLERIAGLEGTTADVERPDVISAEGTEYIPGVDEVRGQFERIMGGEYEIADERKDDKGLYYLKAVKAIPVGSRHSLYLREGEYPNDHPRLGSIKTEITFWDSDGDGEFIIYPSCAAELQGNTWKEYPVEGFDYVNINGVWRVVAKSNPA
ncbi:hypothetical protein KBD45_06325 [Candidatus Dojkabacteria bacterium]|nr:hypothetical protein [Candidatus Dojkabacteria bacterium]